MPVSDAAFRRYLAEVQELIDELAGLNATGLVRIRAEFTALIDDIVAALPRGVVLDSAMIATMIDSLGRRIDDYAISFGVEFGDVVSAQTEANNRIFALLDRATPGSLGSLGIVGTSPELLDIASSMSLGLITNLTQSLEQELRRVLRLAALGPGGRVMDASAAINAVLTGNRKWSSRAERIYRTETLRMHSIETQLRMDEFAKFVPLDKMWIWSQISRAEHAVISGQRRRHNGMFDVPLREGGVVQMRFPRDPIASSHPSAVINCGCYVVPLISGGPAGSVPT